MNGSRKNKERRLYQRSALIKCDGKISVDGKNWTDALILDISSDGIRMIASDEYAAGDLVCCDLKVYGFMSEFKIDIKGVVKHKKPTKDGEAEYGVSFQNLETDIKIRIDEVIISDSPKNIFY
ncbi:MAG: PilZ domain-containing protein [Clostridiales bacterium]|jgi:hypothetical protein|nr:PilZ domain-containing protein [Clostridiales bacterium]